MASGLIYIAIVGMWVAYFVPRWVNSHDEFSGKSAERYKSALRTVTNANGVDSASSPVAHTDLDNEAKVSQLLRRRRITFALISITMIFSLLEITLNSAPITYSLLPLTGFTIYLVHVRRQSVAKRLQHRRIKQLQRSAVGVSTTNLSQVLAPKATQDHWVPLSERELIGVVILPQGSSEDRKSWSPTNVPVPTYVTAPKAFSPARIIDLTIPGAWTEEQERLALDALSAVAPSPDQVFDQQLADEAVERLRDNRAASE